MKISDLPAFKRPREKLLDRGAGALTEAELLTIILGHGYHGKSSIELAEEILKTFSLKAIAEVSMSELKQIKGLGMARSARLIAALKLGQLVAQQTQRLRVTQPEIVFQLTHALVAKKQEHLVCLYLDGRHQLLHQETIFKGTLNSSLLHPREVFAPAIQLRAAGVIVVHNHPSGDTTPSEEDITATEKLCAAGEILDIPIIDHVIVGSQGWSSLKSLQLI